MTAYNDLADSKISLDAPITQEVLTAIRDNPIAITEGSSGAPKVVRNAYADDGVVAGDYSVFPLFSYPNGNRRPFFRFYNTSTISAGGHLDSAPWVVGINGVYRFRLGGFIDGFFGIGSVTVGVAVDNVQAFFAPHRSSEGHFTKTVVDLALVKGQEVTLTLNNAGGGTIPASHINIACYIGVAYKSALGRGLLCAEDINDGTSVQDME